MVFRNFFKTSLYKHPFHLIFFFWLSLVHLFCVHKDTQQGDDILTQHEPQTGDRSADTGVVAMAIAG